MFSDGKMEEKRGPFLGPPFFPKVDVDDAYLDSTSVSDQRMPKFPMPNAESRIPNSTLLVSLEDMSRQKYLVDGAIKVHI